MQTAGGSYAGSVTLAHGTILSDNTVYAQLAIDLGAENIVDMARRLGVKKATLDPFPSIALGGLTNGVSPLEVTSVYATFASGGVYRKPHVISRGQGLQGQGAEEVPPQGPARDLRRCGLRGHEDPRGQHARGTGTNARSSDNRPQAGKTGTTDNYTDAWFCGYTPDIATCVWVGYPNERREMYNIEGYSSVSGPTLPSDIWHLYMDRVFTELLKTPDRLPAADHAARAPEVLLRVHRQGRDRDRADVPQETVEAEISTEAPGRRRGAGRSGRHPGRRRRPRRRAPRPAAGDRGPAAGHRAARRRPAPDRPHRGR